MSLVGVDDCEGSCDRFAEIVSEIAMLASCFLLCAMCAARLQRVSGVRTEEFVHSCQLARTTTSNLLYSQRAQLRLEVVELPLQVILVLSPEVLGLDSGGVRLSRSSAFVQRERRVRSYHLDGSCWVKMSENRL